MYIEDVTDSGDHNLQILLLPEITVAIVGAVLLVCLYQILHILGCSETKGDHQLFAPDARTDDSQADGFPIGGEGGEGGYFTVEVEHVGRGDVSHLLLSFAVYTIGHGSQHRHGSQCFDGISPALRNRFLIQIILFVTSIVRGDLFFTHFDLFLSMILSIPILIAVGKK